MFATVNTVCPAVATNSSTYALFAPITCPVTVISHSKVTFHSYVTLLVWSYTSVTHTLLTVVFVLFVIPKVLLVMTLF